MPTPISEDRQYARTAGNLHPTGDGEPIPDGRLPETLRDSTDAGHDLISAADVGAQRVILGVTASEDVADQITAAVDELKGAAGPAFDTLKEIQDTVLGDETSAAALAAVVAGKLAKASNFSDLPDLVAAHANLKLSSINVKVYGAKGDGTTDDTAAIRDAVTAAEAAGGYHILPVYFPAGRYKVTSTILLSGIGGKYYGDGESSVIVSFITDGTSALKVTPGTYDFVIQGLAVEGNGRQLTDTGQVFANFIANVGGTSRAPNFIGLEINNSGGIYSSHFTVRDVTADFCRTGFKIGGFTANLKIQASACEVGLSGSVMNNTHLEFKSESCRQASAVVDSLGLKLDSYLDEGNGNTSISSTFDNCRNLVFTNIYCEWGVTYPRSQSYITVGGTTECQNVKMEAAEIVGSSDLQAGVYPLIFDRVNGLDVDGTVAEGSQLRKVKTTANTKNIRRLSVKGNQGSWPQDASRQSGTGYNYFSNRNFKLGIKGWTSLTLGGCTVSLDTTNKWRGGQGLKLLCTAAAGNSYAIFRVSGDAVLALRGQTVRLGAWVWVPNISAYDEASPGTLQYAAIQIQNAGGTAGNSANVSGLAVKNEWQFMFTEIAVQADSTSLDLVVYANWGGATPAGTEYITVGEITLTTADTPVDRQRTGDLLDSPLIAAVGVGGRMVAVGTAAPTGTVQTYAVGDYVRNSSLASNGILEWRCTVAGTPGTWVPIFENQNVDVRKYGAIFDGTSHPISQWLTGSSRDRGYADLEAIMADYPHVYSLNNEIDWAATQAAANAAAIHGTAASPGKVKLPPGIGLFDETLSLGYGFTFQSVVVEGAGRMFYGVISFAGTAIKPTHRDRPVVAFQGGREDSLRDVVIINPDYTYYEGLAFTGAGCPVDDSLEATWHQPTYKKSAYGKFSPHAGIAVDPYSGTGPSSWASGTVYAADSYVVNNFKTYYTESGGTSAGSGGPTGTGLTITDNTVTWEYVHGVNVWAATTAYTVGTFVKNGANVYVCVTAGTSAGSGGPTGTSATVAVTDGTTRWRFRYVWSSSYYPPVAYPPAPYGSPATQMGKVYSHVTILDNVVAIGFPAGFVSHPCNDGNQADFQFFLNCRFDWCVYGISIGNDQGRLVGGLNTILGKCFCALSNASHGLKQGKFGGTWLNCCFDASVYWAKLNAAYSGPVSFKNCYSESAFKLFSVTSVTSGNARITMEECEVSFDAQSAIAPRGVSALVVEGPGSMPLTMTNCVFESHPSVLSFFGPPKQYTVRESRLSPFSTRPQVYEKLAHNALGGGWVFQPNSNGKWNRPGEFSADTPYTWSFDTSDVAVDAGILDCRDPRPCSRAIPAPLWVKWLQNFNALDEGVVPAPGNRWYLITKGSFTSVTLTNLTLTLVFAGWPEAYYLQYGPTAGDVLVDSETGTIFFIRYRSGTTIKAEMQNNYKTADGGTTYTPVTPFSTSTGYLYVGNTRVYIPATPTECTVVKGESSIVNVGYRGFDTALVTTQITTEFQVGDKEALASPDMWFDQFANTITAISSAAVNEVQTMTFGAAATGGTMRLWVPKANGTLVLTDAITWDTADATWLAAINTALNAATGVSGGIVATGAAPDTALTFTFSGTGYAGVGPQLRIEPHTLPTSVTTSNTVRTTVGGTGKITFAGGSMSRETAANVPVKAMIRKALPNFGS